MVARALDFKTARLAGVYPDSGVSEDAGRLRERLGEALGFLFPDQLLRAFEDLDSACEEASEENWDGYGAAAALPASYSHAVKFLVTLPLGTPAPDIGVDPDGEVSFTWQRAPRRVFSISFRPDGTLSYAGLFGRNKAHGTETFIGVVPKAILANLDRLYSAQE